MEELFVGEVDFADLGVDVAAVVHSEGYLTSLCLRQSLWEFFERQQSAQFGVGHQTFGTEQLSVGFELGDMRGSSEQLLEIDGSFLKLNEAKSTSLRVLSLR